MLVVDVHRWPIHFLLLVVNMTDSPMVKLNGLTDREAVLDAIHRFYEGMDDAKPDLIRSAFTTDAILDTSPLSMEGRPFPKLSGQEEIVNGMMAGMGQLDCSHHVSNFRCQLGTDSVDFTVSALVKQFAKGEADDPRKTNSITGGTRSRGTATRAEAGQWRIQFMTMRRQWAEGDMSMTFDASSQ